MRQLFILFIIFSVSCITAQTSESIADSTAPKPLIDYKNPKNYQIGGITVKGAEYTDANGIIAISGLIDGQNIKLPGDRYSAAIRKLWKQGLFVDVSVNIDKIVGDIVFLEIVVQEYPRYSRHGFKGIPKGQHEDANAAIKRYLQKGRAASPAMKLLAINAIKGIYIEKGFLDIKINVTEEEDKVFKNSVKWTFDINKGNVFELSRSIYTVSIM